jgi:(E)-4-hydroxy-3-methylbut-2-enyl-diphosphate synthase
MKASNPKITIAAYRLLVARLNELGPDWNYPVHLGVTEAGEGEDARIKSAIGIGSLLADGIGDTIRVSLTEDSPHEIPVAKALVTLTSRRAAETAATTEDVDLSFDPFSYQRRASETIERDGVRLGGEELIRVVVRQENFDKIAHKIDKMGDYQAEIVYENAQIREIDPRDVDAIARLNRSSGPQFVTVRNDIDLPVITAFRLLAAKVPPRHPILLKDTLRRSAANDEARMTNDQTSPNDQMAKGKTESSLRHTDFVIPSSLDISHSSLKVTKCSHAGSGRGTAWNGLDSRLPQS